MPRTRRSKKFKVEKPKRNEPYVTDWHALELQALMAVGNFIDYDNEDYARRSMINLLRPHKKNKEKMREILVKAFAYIQENHLKKPRRTPERLKEAKAKINAIAKELWYPKEAAPKE